MSSFLVQFKALSPYVVPVLSLVVVVAVRVWARRHLSLGGAGGGGGERRVSELVVYPIKSCAGVSVQRWPLGRRGLRDDRRWLLVDADGEFVSQRTQPRLALVQPRYEDEFRTLVLAAPGAPSELRLRRTGAAPGAECRVRVWDDGGLAGREESPEAHAWFAAHLNVPLGSVRLVRLDNEAFARPAPTEWQRENGAVNSEPAFADCLPLLLIGQASVSNLRKQLPNHVPAGAADWRRLRPNIVVSNTLSPHEEDHWDQVAVGEEKIKLHIIRQCTRCRLPNVDPDTGIVKGAEPLNTLLRYRAPFEEDGTRSIRPVFGVQCSHNPSESIGKMISIGDVVKPLALREPLKLAPAKPARNKSSNADKKND